jgi:photosystem II stability/assembly factor-like uncharacterized protein
MSREVSSVYISDAYDVFRFHGRLFVVHGTQLFLYDESGNWNAVDYFDQGYIGYPFAVGYGNEGIAVATHWGIYLSQDLGNTWDSLTDYRSEFPPVMIDSMIIVTGFDSLYRSFDLGQTWETLPFPSKWDYGPLKKSNSGLLHAIGEYFGFVSYDKGSSWELINDVHYGLTDIQEVDSSTHLINSEIGFCLIHEDGTHHHAVNHGYMSKYVDFLTIGLEGELFLSTGNENLRSGDWGETWTWWSFMDGLPFVPSPDKIFWFAPDSAYVIAPGSKLFLATNGLTDLVEIFPEDGASLVTNSGKDLYAFDDDEKLWKSIDHGMSWDRIFTSFDEPPMALHAFGEILLMIDQEHRIWHSPDAGESWDMVYEASTSLIWESAVYHIGTKLLFPIERQWLISEDGGASWEELDPFGLPIESPPVPALVEAGKVLFALIPGHGVYVSYSEGLYWESFNEGLGTLRGTTLNIYNQTLVLGTAYSSLWERDITQTVHTVSPVVNASLNIYPVPVTGAFQILLPQDLEGIIHVDLYDGNGRKLLSRAIPGDEGLLSIDDLDLPEGLFLATISQGNKTYRGKFIVIN